jgi:hypothetical protein
MNVVSIHRNHCASCRQRRIDNQVQVRAMFDAVIPDIVEPAPLSPKRIVTGLLTVSPFFGSRMKGAVLATNWAMLTVGEENAKHMMAAVYFMMSFAQSMSSCEHP